MGKHCAVARTIFIFLLASTLSSGAFAQTPHVESGSAAPARPSAQAPEPAAPDDEPEGSDDEPLHRVIANTDTAARSQFFDHQCPRPRRGLNSGRLTPRECTLNNLRVAGHARNYDWVVHSARTLNGFYERRSERQQRFLDIGAAVTWTGAVGAGFAGRVGTPTQRAWLGLAFLPVLLSTQNAHEPTRDLYYGGSIGLQMIAARYATLSEAARLAEALPYSDAQSLNCADADEALRKIGLWDQGDDRAALLPEAQRIARQCHDLALAGDEYQNTIDMIDDNFQQNWAIGYANDVYALDQTLLAKDYHFRYSPSETIGMMIAAPLRSLDSLISGQNPDQALKTLQTAEAFEGLDQTLAGVMLPPRPRRVSDIAELSAEARARAQITERDEEASPTTEDVITEMQTLNAALTEMREEFGLYRMRQPVLDSLYAAAESRQLSFAFRPSSGQVTVRLGPIGSAAPPAPVQDAPAPEETPAPAQE